MKTKFYSKLLLLVLCSMSIRISFGQLPINAPNVEAIYGGRIIGLTGYSRTTDSSRIFCATESANSVFYTDVKTPVSSSSNFATWTVMPTLNADSNFGYISNMAVHTGSGRLFFTYGSNLYSTSTTASSNTVEATGGPYSLVMIEGDYIFFSSGGQLYFGTLNPTTGSLTMSVGSPISFSGGAMSKLVVNPTNNLVYFFVEGRSGAAPSLYVSSSVYSSFSGTTSFSNISPASLSSDVDWVAFGIAPSGRMFIGGHYDTLLTTKYIATSDDNSVTWSSYNSGMSGVSGNTFDFSGTASSYYVYYSKLYNNNSGANGSWYELGNPGGMETHPNDGAVLVDPNDTNVVYMTTDQGVGASYNRGMTIFEIDNGVEAVQVSDIVMTSDKNTAWIASKSGIRKVSNYQSTKNWSNAEWPGGDGSPYYAVDMNPNDTNTVFVGNVRVYKTTTGNGGFNQVFTPENAPYYWIGVGYHFSAIKVCPWNSNIIVAGAYMDDSRYGGLFYSNDGGVSWSQQYLHATSGYYDADVHDVEFNLEGTDTIVYVGVEWGGGPGVPYSIYKLTRSGSAWTVAQDMQYTNTSTGAVIVSTIKDIFVSTTRDTIFACGINSTGTHATQYYKILSGTGKWTPFVPYGYSGLPSNGIEASSITYGVDTAYMAIGSDVYYFPAGASSWYLGYSYPVGTEINFLYYDELLVGTSTGLYGHDGMQNNLRIITQPESVIKCVNSSALFYVEANGNGTLSYQWKKNNVSIPGATNDTITFTNVSPSDTGSYSVVVTSTTGLVAPSNIASLRLSASTAINTNPSSISLTLNSTASFSVSATGNSLTYQWYKNNVALSGATNSTYSKNNISFADSGSYRVLVNGTCGSANSNAAYLSVSMPAPSNFAYNVRLYLEAFYENGLMRSVLRNSDNISPLNLCDTITFSLMDSSTRIRVYNIKAVIDTAGKVQIMIPNTYLNTRKYIGINHRNSIETWSANPILLSSASGYSFINSASKAKGNNLRNNGSGIFMIYSGDINQDGSVDFNDFPALDISNNDGDLGYFVTDLNGDGSVDFNDYPLLDINSNDGIISITP